MRVCTEPSYYDGVPVLLWPWVFWQLLQIDLWVEDTGRAVYGAVCRRTGRVYVDFWEDDPSEEQSWTPEDLQALLPNSPAWRAALSAIHRAGGAGAGINSKNITDPDLCEWRTALSPVYVSGEAAIRDLLRAVCAEGAQNSAQTQTSITRALPLPEI